MESKLLIEELIQKIKEKKELSSLDNNTIEELLSKELQNTKINLEKYSSFNQFYRSSICKKIISNVRSKLREIYGVFIKEGMELSQLKNITSYDDKIINKILSQHQSSNERLHIYSSIYKKIFEIIKLPKKYKLLDLACGYNPLSYKYLPTKPEYYLASDLSSKDMNIIKEFFIKTKIKGDTIALDLTKKSSILKLNEQNFDVCFLFKALDSLESISRHSSKKLIAELNCKHFVVSFPSKTIGGKKQISKDKRSWFENFCHKNNFEFKFFEFDNEIFYIFDK